MAFEILMNGVGNAFSRRHWGTNFLLRGDDDYLLGIDCPDSYRRALMQNDFEHGGEPLDVEHLDGMLITHLHGDHVNGLEMVLAYYRYVVEDTLDLFASTAVTNVLWQDRIGCSLGRSWDGERYQTLTAEDYYDLHEICWGEPTPVGPFEIEMRQTVHHLPTSALRISDGDVTLGYSCDTAFDPSLIEWLSDCDRIIHETSYGPGHTPLFELLDLPDEIREKMLVVHLPEDLDEVSDEVAIEFAEEGRVYRVA